MQGLAHYLSPTPSTVRGIRRRPVGGANDLARRAPENRHGTGLWNAATVQRMIGDRPIRRRADRDLSLRESHVSAVYFSSVLSGKLLVGLYRRTLYTEYICVVSHRHQAFGKLRKYRDIHFKAYQVVWPLQRQSKAQMALRLTGTLLRLSVEGPSQLVPEGYIVVRIGTM